MKANEVHTARPLVGLSLAYLIYLRDELGIKRIRPRFGANRHIDGLIAEARKAGEVRVKQPIKFAKR